MTYKFCGPAAKKLMALFFLIMPAVSFGQNTKAGDQTIFDRIAYLYDLKAALSKETWVGFSEKEYDVPIIYYTDDASYVANPTARILRFLRPELVFQNETLKIYQTHPRVDTIEHHMSISYERTDSLRQYNYNLPCMKCSSPEMTLKKNPSATSTEKWAALVLHEYFHGFQYNHKALIEYSKNNYLYISGDGFNKIYKRNPWFKEKVDKENELLLMAIGATDSVTTMNLLKKFFALRDARRKSIKLKLNFNLEQYEKYYETLEGTARYMEYSLYQQFASMPVNETLAKSDPLYRSGGHFKNYRIENDDWLYTTGKTSYIYVIGFNMTRLLDKLKIEYKSTLFADGNFSLEDILRTVVTVKDAVGNKD